jgi:hypothetical protein
LLYRPFTCSSRMERRCRHGYRAKVAAALPKIPEKPAS